MSKQISMEADKTMPDLPAAIGSTGSDIGLVRRRFALGAGLIGVAILASACSGPLRQQAPGASVPADVPAQGKRIAPDGAGGLLLPDGSRVAVDQAGGFQLPNGEYVRRDRSGTLILPNGARCIPDRQGGFLCP